MSKDQYHDEWIHHVQNIREQERSRIAREIHDELGQLLTAIKVEAFLISGAVNTDDPALREQLTRMLSLVSEASKAIERIATELRPGILSRLGLVLAIDWQTKEFEKRSRITSSVVFRGNLNVESEASLNIFRVYQEALTNVARHSSATRVDTKLELKGNTLSLTIRDNGKGFDPNSIKTDSALGLTGMKERASMLGGECSIESNIGKGTMIHFVIPVKTQNG